MDEYGAIQALRLLTKQWDAWYKIRRIDGQWHAKRRDSGDQFHAGTHVELNLAIIRHFMDGMRLAQLSPMGIAQEVELAETRQRHSLGWEYIGPDTDTPGWRASRTAGDVTHHVVTQTLAQLNVKLAALEAADGDETPVG